MEGSSPDRNTLLFRFDSKGHRSPEDIKTREKSCLRACLCNKCVICLTICLVILVVAGAAATFMVMQAFDLSGSNFTTFDGSKSAAEFYRTWEVPEGVKDKAQGYIRRDKNNLTAWFVDFGRWELDVLLRGNGTEQDLNTYIDQTFYRIRSDFNNHDHNSSWALVVNMDGYGISQAFDFTATAYLQELVKRYRSNFQTLDYAVVINLPSWARFLTGIMKPLMGNLLDKFEMFGYKDWLPALVTRFDAQELPKGYSKYVGDGDGDADGNEGWSSWF